MLPVMLEKSPALIGKRRVTAVFDSGGCSPRLRVWLIEQGFDVLTYSKGRSPRVPSNRFRVHAGRLDDR